MAEHLDTYEVSMWSSYILFLYLAVNVRYLTDIKLSCKNYPAESLFLEPLNFLRISVVCLCTRMDGRSPVTAFLNHLCYRHILHKDGINTGIAQFSDELPHVWDFILIDNGV